ncbi:MAG TPA: hypothetical protein DF984_00400 [Anaerolineaceae bacterium]|nr:hypothetical protein [Anaerolineaceae bacterium]
MLSARLWKSSWHCPSTTNCPLKNAWRCWWKRRCCSAQRTASNGGCGKPAFSNSKSASQTAWVQEIDFSPGRGLQRQQILQLAGITWIRKALNLIILSPTGAGKTYIACALGRAACEQDLGVRYFRLPRFFQTLKLAQLEGTYPKLVKSLHNVDLLILDDWLRDPLTLIDA